MHILFKEQNKAEGRRQKIHHLEITMVYHCGIKTSIHTFIITALSTGGIMSHIASLLNTPSDISMPLGYPT